MKQRKVLVGIAIAIFIILLLYWLLVVAPVTTPTVVREQCSYVYTSLKI